ncbi:MAG: hypothetical protein Q4F29_01595 [Lachnospiraceae bacterium]|nr:hypothetical protein [Lachnospiraceae bacterium]
MEHYTNRNKKELKRKNCLYCLLPAVGTVFCLAYILAATRDVVYSDYIRLINSYLPDVWNPDKFFVADIVTRMPVNFIERIINVTFFDYSTTFEMVLGVLCLGAAGLVLAAYCRERQVGVVWYLMLMAVFFSLNKWEMLTNGTGWCHFLAFAGFYYHYVLWDRVWKRQEKKLMTLEKRKQDQRERRLLMLLPWLIILGTAGPYCGAYAAVLILTYGFCLLIEWKRTKQADRRILCYMGNVLAPMCLYLVSSSFAVSEHAGATGRSISQVMGDNFMLFPKFILKSLSSMVVGSEPMLDFLAKLDKGMALCYLAGAVVLAGYGLALWMQMKRKLYRVSVFPLMLLLWGGLNHLLVLAARWIFENSDYGMSSRYALQYQVGILGMLLTFALVWKLRREGRRSTAKPEIRQKTGRSAVWSVSRLEMAAAIVISAVILCGNVYTTCKEVEKAPNRRQYAAEVEQVLLNYRETDDEVLEKQLQYHKGTDKIRRALQILEEQNWNVYGGN